MTLQTINIGVAPNDGTGDPLRTAFDKTNQNFVELYSNMLGVNTDAQYTWSNTQTFNGEVSIANNLTVSGNLTTDVIIANGSLGTAGQVLTTNSTGVYWSTVSGGGGGSVNVDAQYTWTNTQTFQNTITVAAISSNGSTGTAGQVLTSNGTSTYWSTVNATGSSSVNVDAQYIWTNTQTFQNTITFSSTIDGTANNTLYVGSVTAANVVSNAQLQANLGNYQTTAGLAANVATLTSNNSVYFDGRSSSYFSNASNINTGTLPYSQLGTNVVNTTSNFSLSGVLTLNSNVVFNASVVDSTGNTGTTGQILTTNGANTYWSSKYYVGSLPPTYPNYGDTWYYTDMEKLFMWINDGGSDYWYDFLPPA